MRQILFTTTLFLACTAMLQAQSVTYAYDAAGNRISRTIELAPPPAGSEMINIFDGDTQTLAENFKPTETYNDPMGNHEVVIYPNPTGGQLVVRIKNINYSGDKPVHATITIHTISGQTIYSKSHVPEYNDIDLTAQQPGIYIMNIVIGNRKTTWKIIKK